MNTVTRDERTIATTVIQGCVSTNYAKVDAVVKLEMTAVGRPKIA